MEPDSDWITNKNLLNMKYFYTDHLHLITEVNELAKTISMSLMNEYPYKQDNVKQSYRILQVYVILTKEVHLKHI